MPFGITNAPAVFQALINDVLHDFLNRFVFIFLDNILIFSQLAEKHFSHVCQVLILLLENKLFVKAEKCKFHVDSVVFGLHHSEWEYHDGPQKTQAVEERLVPKTQKE